MRLALGPAAHDRRLLDESLRTRTMLWIMAIMLLLTVLAGALGLGMYGARIALDRQLAGRLTVQIVEPDDQARDRHAGEITARLRALPEVANAQEVDRAHLAQLLEPWLGKEGLEPDLPMPAMIDVDLRSASPAAAARVERAARAIVPDARVDRHAQWLSPVSSFITTMCWVAAGLVLLMASATTAVVLLAARSGLDTHRDTIAVLHILGSTDVQIARLFQRRIALDTLVGGLLGTLSAAGLILFLQARVGALQSELLNGVALQRLDWTLLTGLPILFALLATFAARAAVLGALEKTL